MQDDVEDVLSVAETRDDWEEQSKRQTLSCRARVWCVMGCASVSDLLGQYDVQCADKVLNARWQELGDPENTPVQSLIILEDKEKQKERAERARGSQRERERASSESARVAGRAPDKNRW